MDTSVIVNNAWVWYLFSCFARVDCTYVCTSLGSFLSSITFGWVADWWQSRLSLCKCMHHEGSCEPKRHLHSRQQGRHSALYPTYSVEHMSFNVLSFFGRNRTCLGELQTSLDLRQWCDPAQQDLFRWYASRLQQQRMRMPWSDTAAQAICIQTAIKISSSCNSTYGALQLVDTHLQHLCCTVYQTTTHISLDLHPRLQSLHCCPINTICTLMVLDDRFKRNR